MYINFTNEPKVVKIADDIGTNGKWNTIVYKVDGKTAKIHSGLIDRLRGYIASLFITDLSKEERFYVREIVFFANAEDAEKYAEAAPTYYNSIAGTNAPASAVEPFEKVTGTTFTVSADNTDQWYVSPYITTPEYTFTTTKSGYSYIHVTDCTTNGGGGAVGGSKYYFTFGSQKSTVTTANTNACAVITWATDKSASDYPLVLYHWGNIASVAVTDHSEVVVADSVATGGKWASAKISNIDTLAMLKRWSNKVYFYTKDPNINFYIKEIVVFATEEDANDYLASAPAFYNTYAPLVTE